MHASSLPNLLSLQKLAHSHVKDTTQTQPTHEHDEQRQKGEGSESELEHHDFDIPDEDIFLNDLPSPRQDVEDFALHSSDTTSNFTLNSMISKRLSRPLLVGGKQTKVDGNKVIKKSTQSQQKLDMLMNEVAPIPLSSPKYSLFAMNPKAKTMKLNNPMFFRSASQPNKQGNQHENKAEVDPLDEKVFI